VQASFVLRFTAVLLLLLTAGDAFVCHWISSVGCKLAGAASENSDPEDEFSRDGCLCCCRHAVTPAPILLSPPGWFELG